MTKDNEKIALRRNCFKRWKQGLMKALDREPGEGEIRSFIAGFNMGYKAHKQKRLRQADLE